MREWWTRDHLSAISAISPEGKLYFRSRVIKGFLAKGAAQRIHLEQLPAYAPELNPGEGLWQQLKGVELCNQCCLHIPLLPRELRAAVSGSGANRA